MPAEIILNRAGVTDDIRAERERCVKLILQMAEESDKRGAAQYYGVRPAFAIQVVEKIRSADNK